MSAKCFQKIGNDRMEKILERHLEDILTEYPELIEPGLIFIQRQISSNNRRRRIDLQFQDKRGNNLFVELKNRYFNSADVRQVLAYYAEFKRAQDSRIRLMVVARGFSWEAWHTLRYLGVELKRIKLPSRPDELNSQMQVLPI